MPRATWKYLHSSFVIASARPKSYKMVSTTLSFLLLAAQPLLASPLNIRQASTTEAQSAPAPESTAWIEATGVPTFPIHESCNATERRQLERALDETVKLVQHAQKHLLHWGNKSEIVQKYFGDGSTAEAVGWYTRVIGADRGAMTFRCDDPDGNCAANPESKSAC